jgi:hypothetical protein
MLTKNGSPGSTMESYHIGSISGPSFVPGTPARTEGLIGAGRRSLHFPFLSFFSIITIGYHHQHEKSDGPNGIREASSSVAAAVVNRQSKWSHQ